MKNIKQSTLLPKILLFFGAITLACNLPTAAVEGAYGDEGVEESLFLIEDFRIEPEIGLPGEFTLIIEDYDYFDDGDGGANSIDCEYTYGVIGTFDGDDFRKDAQGSYLREMSDENRFTRKFETNGVGEYEVYCINPGFHAVGNFQVAIQFFPSDCQDQFSIDAGMQLRPENTRANNSELSCLWTNGETTSAALKVNIAYVYLLEETTRTFDEFVNNAKNTSAYCKNYATPRPEVNCSCAENEISESEYYRRERNGGCIYESGLITKDLEIEEVIIHRNRSAFVIHISSQEHNTEQLLYPDLHETALAQANAFIDARFPGP